MPIDIFDETELSPVDKAFFSSEFQQFLSEAIKKEIAKIPVEKIFGRLDGIEKKIVPIDKKADDYKNAASTKIEGVSKDLAGFYQTIKSEIDSLKKDWLLDSKADSAFKQNFKTTNEKTLAKISGDQEEFMSKQRKKYDELMTKFLNLGQSSGHYQGGPKASGSSQTYTTSNVTTARTLNATNTSLDELASFVATLIVDLQGVGILK